MRIAEAELGTTALALDRMNGVRENPDNRLRVQFGMFPEIDQEATAKEGRPIYKEKEYITIMVPGDRDVIHRPVWQRDLERFPVQYQAFKNNLSQDAVSGTPLKLVPWLTLGQVKELEFFNCSTVEQLAAMPDNVAGKFMAINKIRQLAKDYLQAAKEAAPLTALRSEIDKKDNELEVLRRQVSALTKKVEELAEEDE